MRSQHSYALADASEEEREVKAAERQNGEEARLIMGWSMWVVKWRSLVQEEDGYRIHSVIQPKCWSALLIHLELQIQN